MRKWLARTFTEDSGLSAIARPSLLTAAPLACAGEAGTIDTDANGSPLASAPATWLICFVPGLRRQWWHPFADARHKHVFALRSLGDGTWLLVEPWWTRMMVTVLPLDEAMKFLRWGAMGDILRVCESIPGRGSQLRGWANCSVLVSFLLGRSYWTWTPNGLYRKLLAEPDVETMDLACFLKAHLQEEVNRHANVALKTIPVRRDERLAEVLVELGTAVVTAMVSPSEGSKAAPVAQGLIREVGESLREIVRGDDWESVAGWAEVLWGDYATSTGLTWEQASGRIRLAWDSYGIETSCSRRAAPRRLGPPPNEA